MIKIHTKPLSVNECWKGKRFKTQKYKDYERLLMYLLPQIKIPESPFAVRLEFGFSSAGSDIDNPLKPFFDIMQKRYGFNDRDIWTLFVQKMKVKKGEEYIKFEITKCNQTTA